MKPKTVNRLRLHPEQTCLYRGHHVWVMDRRGMIGSQNEGYYLRQTRFLSRFELKVNGERPRAAGCNIVEPHSAVSYHLVRSPSGQAAAPPGDNDPTGGEIVENAIEIHINSYVGAKLPKAARGCACIGPIPKLSRAWTGSQPPWRSCSRVDSERSHQSS